MGWYIYLLSRVFEAGVQKRRGFSTSGIGEAATRLCVGARAQRAMAFLPTLWLWQVGVLYATRCFFCQIRLDAPESCILNDAKRPFMKKALRYEKRCSRERGRARWERGKCSSELRAVAGGEVGSLRSAGVRRSPGVTEPPRGGLCEKPPFK